VQEFLDLRSLSINNIVMSASFGACLLIYSAYNSQFRGIRQTAYAFFMSGIAFLLIGLRNYIPDFLSIVLPNTLLTLSMASIHLGFIYFYQLDTRLMRQFHGVMLLTMASSAVYFTYVQHSVNARIIAISFIIGFQCLYIMRTLLTAHNKANFTIGISYLAFAIFFIIRGILTFTQDSIDDFMTSGLMHAISIIVYELLVAVTSFGVVWIVSYKVQRALIEQASHDPLTKVLNRRALENIINVEHSRSLRSNVSMSVIMLDIDHFKRINDVFGHGRGDEVLVEVASILTNNTRKYDSIARFGGEEFIILLPDTALDKAQVIAENLRIKIAESDFNFNPEDGIQITASFGATECNLQRDGWLKILERADHGLYQAKAAGRNQVVVCSSNNQDAERLITG
jgi:diguanylate cyclase (GGDEF)-like protein